ncbi:MAG: TadG family pilus assembly protein [Parvibaculum sp.]
MPLSLFAFLRRYRRDERGVVSVMAVGALVLALAVSMIVIDTGAMLYARRDLQAATDAAALGAVRQLDNAESAAQSVFDLNEYASSGMTVIRGEYTADPARAPDERFDPDADESNFNAVRVTKTASSPTYFARLFGFGGATAIDATATAAYVKTVSFSAGTRLAELNEGLANQVLGGLLGTTLNLSLVDYNALADANINALSFLDALAAEVNLDAGSDTYGDLLETTVTLGDLAAAAVEVLNGDTYEGDPAVAGVALEAALLPVQNVSVPLDQILNAAPFLNRTIGSVDSGLNDELDFNLLNLVSGAAMAAGAGQAVGFDADVNLGSLASVTGTITVGSPMAHMAAGKVGDSVQTSQVTLQLNAVIDTGIPSLVDAQITLPIYITAAEGTATVSSIPCSRDETMVTLSGTTGAVTARYGTEADSSPEIATIELPVLFLGTIPVATLNASGSYDVGSGGPSGRDFTQADIDEGGAKTVSSDANIFSGLGEALSIEDVVLLGLPPISGLASTLSGIVSTLLSAIGDALIPVDGVVSSLLTTLGIKLGAMDMVVHGTKCRAPTLVG